MIAEAVAGQLVISPAGTADRHHLASTAAANAYAYLPDGPGARRRARRVFMDRPR